LLKPRFWRKGLWRGKWKVKRFRIWRLIYDVFQANSLHFTCILRAYFSLHMGWLWKIMSDSILASTKILKLILWCVPNQQFALDCPFQPPHEGDVKNNIRFRFAIPEYIELDIIRFDVLQLNTFPFTPILGAPFQSPYGANVKDNVGFDIHKNI